MEAVGHFNISIDAGDDDGITDIPPPSLSHPSSLDESAPLFFSPSSPYRLGQRGDGFNAPGIWLLFFIGSNKKVICGGVTGGSGGQRFCFRVNCSTQ
jgi:hypothetical protein